LMLCLTQTAAAAIPSENVAERLFRIGSVSLH